MKHDNKTTTIVPWEIWESSPKMQYYQADVQNTPKPVKSPARHRTALSFQKYKRNRIHQKSYKKDWICTISLWIKNIQYQRLGLDPDRSAQSMTACGPRFRNTEK